MNPIFSALDENAWIYANPTRLAAMSKAAASLARPGAAESAGQADRNGAGHQVL